MRRPLSWLMRIVTTFIAICLCIVGVAAVTGVVSIDAHGQPAQQARTVTLNGTVYLTQAEIQQLFQEGIDKSLPTIEQKFSSTLPAWAQLLAGSLLQPEVKVTSLTPQEDGLRTNLQIVIAPITTISISTLITFKQLNDHTIQISGKPINDQYNLINGPLTTLSLPTGKITGIQTLQSCGAAVLKIGLQMPLKINENSTNNSQKTLNSNAAQQNTIDAQAIQNGIPLSFDQTARTTKSGQAERDTLSAQIEIPNSTLTALTRGLGSINVNDSMQIQNLQLHEQNGKYNASAVVIGRVLQIVAIKPGTVTTTITPRASNGKVDLNVSDTSLHLGSLSISLDSYNQQISQGINSSVNKALQQNNITIESAGVGPTTQVSCAASDSLLIGGSIALPQ